jgi:hypothetical protein
MNPFDYGDCDGTGICESALHWHGCFADIDGSSCSEPDAHD